MVERTAFRWLFAGLIAATMAMASSWLWGVLRADGATPIDGFFLALFAALVGWNSLAFWMSCAGAVGWFSGRHGDGLHWPTPAQSPPSRSRTAIIMPVCNEDPERIFAAVMAIHESVSEQGTLFDFLVLSDSTDPVRHEREVELWRWLRERDAAQWANLYYRHRPENAGRKSGNIKQFCENWGALYDYMVVLDADSLMTGETLRTLVSLMDFNPRAALIQVPPLLVGRESLFARMQQFCASVYGPVYSAGFSLLHGPDSNYWGHNAIIRVAPFMRHCGLPKLSGRPPLGGDILSHDFIEAALLRRAGWNLHLVPQLSGSFEEPPPTLMDFLKRDRRWCQGNMQHLRLIFAQGFRLPSRMHLVSGAMSYLASPLWMLMLIASTAASYSKEHIAPVSYVGKYPILAWPISHSFQFAVLVTTMAILLFAPKLIALGLLLRDRRQRRIHGGALRAVLSVLLESLFSVLIAPVAMLSHCGFVAGILLGRTTGWARQRRGEYRPQLGATVSAFLPHTIVALAAVLFLRDLIPGSFWWLVPILAGPALSIPLAYVTSSGTTGRFARRLGLFLVPSETEGVAILNRTTEIRDAFNQPPNAA